MKNEFLNQMFCIDGRLSLTKLGAAFKGFSLSLGSAFTGAAYLESGTQGALWMAVATASLAAVGNWIEEVGKRNAMEKKQ